MEKYKVFSVGWDHVILPEGGPFSKGWDRFVGNRVVEVVDTNHNGQPDNGDTAILTDGSRVSRAKFSHPLVQKKVREEDELTLSFRKLRGKGTIFDVRDVSPRSFEAYCIAQADYFQGRQHEAKEIAGNITDNPVAAGAIVTVGTVLLFHPKTRIPTRLAAEWVRALGAAGGITYVVHDRLDGLVNGTPMGEHDFTAGLAIGSGASAFRGVTLKNFANDTLQGLERVRNFFTLGEGGFTPGWVASGAVGGSFIFSGAGALEVAPAIAAGGRLPSAIAGLPIYNLVATFPSAGGGLKTRHLKLKEGFAKLDDAAWVKSRAKNSMDEIRSALEIAKEEAQASGKMEKVVQIESALEELNQNMRVIEEVYRHAPEAEVRVAIETLLSEVERRALSLFHASDSNLTRMILEGVRQRMLIVKDLAGRHGIASFKVPTAGVPFLPSLEIPNNVSLARPLEELLPRDPGSRNVFLDALRRFLEFRRQGQWGLAKFNIRPGLSEAKYHNGNGQRIYFARKDGVTHILRMGDKGTQDSDIALAEKLGKELGLLGIAVFISLDHGTAGSELETAETADR